MTETWQNWMLVHRQRVEKALNRCLSAENPPSSQLQEAMSYAVLNGGKRLRALLIYASGAACAAPIERLDIPACAIELLHAYSLVHDDLPAMDDDDLRRGKPSCHRAFDEATAILAGDALQALAFNILTDETGGGAERRLQMLNTLTKASGSYGMVGGQCIDLGAVGKQLTLAELEIMHAHKTGALIRASVRMGALCGDDVGPQTLLCLDQFACQIGLAFQIQDDVLDVESNTATLGKPQGSDNAMGKPTYPLLLGLAQAKANAYALHEEAIAQLRDFGPQAEPLRWIAQFIVSRRT